VVVVFYLLPEEVVAKQTRMRAPLPAAEDDYQVGVEAVPGSAWAREAGPPQDRVDVRCAVGAEAAAKRLRRWARKEARHGAGAAEVGLRRGLEARPVPVRL